MRNYYSKIIKQEAKETLGNLENLSKLEILILRLISVGKIKRRADISKYFEISKGTVANVVWKLKKLGILEKEF